MANHQDRLARRQRANEELQPRLAGRYAAFDALDGALAGLAKAATGDGDLLTRSERAQLAIVEVGAAASDLRSRAARNSFNFSRAKFSGGQPTAI